jgi:hypothetical protein
LVLLKKNLDVVSNSAGFLCGGGILGILGILIGIPGLNVAVFSDSL